MPRSDTLVAHGTLHALLSWRDHLSRPQSRQRPAYDLPQGGGRRCLPPPAFRNEARHADAHPRLLPHAQPLASGLLAAPRWRLVALHAATERDARPPLL